MRLPSIHDFAAEAFQPERYARLGDDWWLAVADVVGSTKLAGLGRDREVNFSAGAAVAVLAAATAEDGAPGAVQFGGDGALAAVPPGRVEATRQALAALAHWSTTELDIPLRVGMVPVKALTEAGLEVLAALQDFGNDNVFGLFLGAGVTAADAWVKADQRWSVAPRQGELPGIEGLSCRWRPVPAERGAVLCVIIDSLLPGPAGVAALAEVQAELEAVVHSAAAAPLGDGARLAPGLLPSRRSLALETRVESPARRRLRRVKAVVGSLLLGLTHRLGGRLGPLDTNLYRRSLAERSDYRKLAGGTRMVLDVTEAEALAIEARLAAAEALGRIRFGTARCPSTTITCLVGDFSADRHVHFVDGAGLGFWRASQMLKGKGYARS